jgi:hypothetical protein
MPEPLVADGPSRWSAWLQAAAVWLYCWREYRRVGKTMWGSEKWMKEPKYYQGLKTPELARECFRDSVFATEILKYREPQFGLVCHKVMHDGFAELLGRDDLWRGIIGVYEHLGGELTADADLKTVVRVSLTFEALTALYRDPAFKKQVKLPSARAVPGVGDPVPPAGTALRRRQDLPSSWGTPIARLPCSVDAGRTANTRPVRCRGMAPGM